ncbi:hypothetical protein C0V73_00840 [Rhizobium sp. TH135]|uniref:FRG domain-containing protein n=1 Tax=Rhizobium sp. TH135 TaxID=2067451 RepID=UPI000C79EA5F|nr:FRG domain-containing protein [Rhizobium sp. TH135]PLK72415.1 hypothetical protein C0V73_00840 [Rhizobium sp. TH135]
MLAGQWFGELLGYAKGLCVIEIDDLPSGYQGRATFFQEGLENDLVFITKFSIAGRAESASFVARVEYEMVGEAIPASTSDLAKASQGFVLPNEVLVSLSVKADRMDVALTTLDRATDGSSKTVGTLSGVAHRPGVPNSSIVLADETIKDWDSFRDYVLSQREHQSVFRGQMKPYPLRTSFHRTSRKDLYRFAVDDVRRALSSAINVLDRRFDLKDPDDRASFWYLLQHHGFPTPLLDWSASPFVAAYFAFSGVTNETEGSVRIFEFELERWHQDQAPSLSTLNVRPHVTFFQPYPLSNPRAVAQQAWCSICTVDNVEQFVKLHEDARGCRYLKAFDLPKSARAKVMQELRLMGITAASLMPGLDGVFADLKERLFPTVFDR